MASVTSAVAATVAATSSATSRRLNPLVAVAQLTATSNQSENFENVVKCARNAQAAGCSFLALPECFSFIGSSPAETLEQAEPLNGPTVKKYRALAKECGLWLSCGGFHEKPTPESDKVFNSHLLINPSGDIATVYRKIHLFDVNVPNGPVLMESRSTQAGRDLVTFDTNVEGHESSSDSSSSSSISSSSSPSSSPSIQVPVHPPPGVLGLTTCYDLRFPEMYTMLAAQGAEVLLVPSAFTVPTGRAHWEILLRARAIETQCFVLAAAQVGYHNEKRKSWGHAIIIDPWGVVLADAGGFDALSKGDQTDATRESEASCELSPTIIIAELDMARMKEVRQKMPVQQHRRRDLFKIEVR